MKPGILVILILAGWFVVLYIISVFTGWHQLAQRFRFDGGTFRGAKWGFQTGYMRFYSHYGNCLTVGTNPTGLYLAVWPIFRIGHPPLLVPWGEVTVMPARRSMFRRMVELKLGREERIPLRLSATTMDKLKQAAGAAWPMESVVA